jgi:hypothetical protein
MKKIIYLVVLFLLFNINVQAQKNSVSVVYTAGVPASCIYGRLYVDVSTGFVYSYKTGVGCIIVGGAITGSGAANRVALWSGASSLSSDTGFTFSSNNLSIPAGGTFQINGIAFNFTNLAGNIAVSQMNNGTSASSSTYWRGDGTWQTVSTTSGTNYTITGTGGNGYLELLNQSSNPSTPTNAGRFFMDSSNRFSWKGTNGFVRTFDGTANTADRIYVLPDLSLTFAGINVNQTWTGVPIFSNGVTLGTSGNLFGGTNVVEQRNSTNPQRINIANTYTSGANREDLSFYFNANIAHIGTTTTGATARVLQIDYGGTTTAAISIPITSGSIIFGGGLNAPSFNSGTGANGGIFFGTNGNIVSSGAGILTLYNNAQTDFTRLQFGGTTNLFPALKRNTTSLQVRLADDSADGNLTTGNLTVNGTCTGCGSGGATSTNGQSVLAADVAFSSTSFTDVTGLSVTLPSSGTYLITSVINYSANCTTGCATSGPDLYFQLYNSTDATGIPNSQIRTIGNVAALYYVDAVTLNNIVTVAASKTIIVQAKRNAGTYAASNVTGTTADGISRISYIKLS